MPTLPLLEDTHFDGNTKITRWSDNETDFLAALFQLIHGDITTIEGLVSSNFVSPLSYGAVGDGITNDTIAINLAITAIQSGGGGTLFFPPGTYLIDNLTIPEDVTTLIYSGSTFKINSGQTLRINGPINSGLHQIFNCVGTGNVIFGSKAISTVFPEWFGAKTTSDDASAFQLAVDSITTIGGRISLQGEYNIGSTITLYDAINNGLRISGESRKSTIINVLNSFTGDYVFSADMSLSGSVYITSLEIDHIEFVGEGPYTSGGPGKAIIYTKLMRNFSSFHDLSFYPIRCGALEITDRSNSVYIDKIYINIPAGATPIQAPIIMKGIYSAPNRLSCNENSITRVKTHTGSAGSPMNISPIILDKCTNTKLDISCGSCSQPGLILGCDDILVEQFVLENPDVSPLYNGINCGLYIGRETDNNIESKRVKVLKTSIDTIGVSHIGVDHARQVDIDLSSGDNTVYLTANSIYNNILLSRTSGTSSITDLGTSNTIYGGYNYTEFEFYGSVTADGSWYVLNSVSGAAYYRRSNVAFVSMLYAQVNAGIVAGTLDVEFRLGGVSKGSIQLDSVTNPYFLEDEYKIFEHPFSGGSKLDVRYKGSAIMAPGQNLLVRVGVYYNI